jgi:hypothetical protein
MFDTDLFYAICIRKTNFSGSRRISKEPTEQVVRIRNANLSTHMLERSIFEVFLIENSVKIFQ